MQIKYSSEQNTILHLHPIAPPAAGNHSDYCGIKLTARDYAQGKTMSQQMHSLELVIAGNVKIVKADRSQVVGKNEILFKKKGLYNYHPSDDYAGAAIFMSDVFISYFLKQHVRFPSDAVVNGNNNLLYKSVIPAPRREAIVQVLDYLDNPSPYAAYIIKYTAYHFLLEILLSDHSKSFLSILAGIISEPKINIIAFMEDNFTRQMSIADMAKSTARSISVFKKEFVHTFNTTPMRWQLNRRLEYANYLINSTKDPVSAVAYNAGFGNLSHFSKAYKQKYGFTPRKTRICKAS